jgi:phage protein D
MALGRARGWQAAFVAGACLALLLASPVARAEKPLAEPWPGLRVAIAGLEPSRGAERRVVVDGSIDGVDAAEITLTGKKGLEFASDVRLGAGAEVTAAGDPVPVFRGEVVRIDPVFHAGEAVVVVHAFDRLHRLTRGRKTRTFEDVTDADLLRVVAEENGLVPGDAPELVERHPHVFQHDQTDLDFLRARAARIGYEVRTDADVLRMTPVPADPSLLLLAERPSAEGARLLEFRPRLSSSRTVQRVTVRGVDPASEREVVGSAVAATRLLVPGPDSPDLLFGRSVEVEPESPVATEEEAAALARAELARENPLSGEAASKGDPRLRPGVVVSIDARETRFEGAYLVTGVSHRWSHPSGADGYRTLLRLRRLDGALFRLPEIDDEVLVAFEHGDLRRPFVVGSLWEPEEDDERR